jgi:hypothetical protein
LILKRRCGQDFLLKDQSILLLTNHAIFGGKTTAPWFSGLYDDLYIYGFLLTLMLLIAFFFAEATDLILVLLPVYYEAKLFFCTLLQDFAQALRR